MSKRRGNECSDHIFIVLEIIFATGRQGHLAQTLGWGSLCWEHRAKGCMW